MQNVSNRYGRALEYAIVAEIIRRLSQSQLQLTQRALKDQQRDLLNYQNLPASMQQNYQKCAASIFSWLNLNFSVLNKHILLDRLPDHSSIEGDVTDIRLTTGSQEINFSLKHNHKALKHQRPASTAQHCGYRKKSPEDIQFRRDYSNITKSFTAVSQGYHYFRDLGEGVVLRHLQIPICDIVAKFISSFCASQVPANHLFTFLVGRRDFHKVIFYEQQDIVVIQDFSKLAGVTSVTAQNSQNYVYLHFSNDWKISMRLHTASSRIKSNPDLKFDTQPVSIVVPEERLIV